MVLYCESLPPEKEYFSPTEQVFHEVEVTKHILYTFIHSDSLCSPCSISHEWHCSVYTFTAIRLTVSLAKMPEMVSVVAQPRTSNSGSLIPEHNLLIKFACLVIRI